MPAETPFAGFPARTLLEAGIIPVAELAGLALRESHRTSPIFRVHRWFARRVRSQFRAILTGLVLPESAADSFWNTYFGEVELENAVVVDPFVGGGTSLVEATRCGARVIGFDIDPVAVGITRFELGAAGFAESLAAAERVQCAVSTQVRPFHVTVAEDGSEREVLHHFWVQVVPCRECGEGIEVHPHFRLAWNKRTQWTFCSGCHAVREVPASSVEIACSCGTMTRPAIGTLDRNRLTCPKCRHEQPLAPAEEPPRWSLFAQEYLDSTGRGFIRRFKAAGASDRELFDSARRRLAGIDRPLSPVRPIPAEGRSDRRPLIHGVRLYTDLFNARQRLHLALLGREVLALPGNDRLLVGLAYSEHLATNCMYAGYAFGYRRLAPLFSIHAFRHIVRPVELNPWAPVGRGTFPNAVAKLRDAIQFAANPTDLDPAGGCRPSTYAIGSTDGSVARTAEEVTSGSARAAVVVASATELRTVKDCCVDLVLTDPPYFDNVCYSELSDFYLAWQQELGIAEPPYEDPRRPAPLAENLALSSHSEDAVAEYLSALTAIFGECRRVVRDAGIMVFTYHHRSPKAWLAVAGSLHWAGWRCTGVTPMRGEGRGGLHTFAGTIKWDAVVTCRKGTEHARTTGTELMVSAESVDEAVRDVRGWGSRLIAPELGFSDPDMVNLLCANLAVRCTEGALSPDAMTLSYALQAAPALISEKDSGGHGGAPVP
ncbi:MAG TPA: DNA methyltransferase [Armatimonadota bacterium]